MTVEQSVTVPELDLEAIRKRCEAATPGPWEKDYGGTPGHVKSIAKHSLGSTPTVARYDIWFPVAGDPKLHEGAKKLGYTPEQEYANAEFIAYARQDIPALLDHIARLSQPQDAPPVRDVAGVLAGRWLAGKSGPPFTIERRDVDALEDRIATALSARDRLLAEAKEALEPFAKYHDLDGVQNGHHEDELIVGIRGADGCASINYGDLRRAASAYRKLSGARAASPRKDPTT